MEVIVNSTYSTALNFGYWYMVCVYKNFIGNSSELCLCVCICHENYYIWQIFLYYDELELCNPLGSRRGVHKIGMLY